MYRFEKCKLKKAKCYGGDYYHKCFFIEFIDENGKKRDGYTDEYTTDLLKSHKPGQDVGISFDHTTKRGMARIALIIEEEEYEQRTI